MNFSQTHDATRSLVKVANKAQSTALSSAPGGSDGGAVVTSLKQKVHSLEQALRKKESDVTELKRSVGATQVNELKIQVEVYCREIDRYAGIIIYIHTLLQDMNLRKF